jgi:ATP-dependent helicase HrpA
MDSLFTTVALVTKIISASREADKTIKGATSIALIAPLGDARSQLDALVYPGFVAASGLEHLRRIPVYLAALIHRVSKLPENPGRDRAWMNDVQLATERYIRAGGSLPLKPDSDPRLVKVRWMIEELRVSLFAQHLATTGPVSLQRITKALEA